jgi:hypothetical protein
MKVKQTLPVAVVALVLGGVAGALVLPTTIEPGDVLTSASKQAGWTEVQWPFPLDQFGRGKAFRCSEPACGTAVALYVRAKIGFCNCKTGVADDAELERIGDLELLGARATPLNDGRPITVAWMKGRSRAYAIDDKEPTQSALSIGYNDRCDAIVATAVLPHGRPGDAEATVLQFLNGPTVMRWAELALGL